MINQGLRHIPGDTPQKNFADDVTDTDAFRQLKEANSESFRRLRPHGRTIQKLRDPLAFRFPTGFDEGSLKPLIWVFTRQVHVMDEPGCHLVQLGQYKRRFRLRLRHLAYKKLSFGAAKPHFWTATPKNRKFAGDCVLSHDAAEGKSREKMKCSNRRQLQTVRKRSVETFCRDVL